MLNPKVLIICSTLAHVPLIHTRLQSYDKFNFAIRIVTGVIWVSTVMRRLTPDFGGFENRITEMGSGTTIFPENFMNFAIENWFLFYLIVISLEILSSLSLISGTFTRGGAFLATGNGFAIGMAGIGLGLMDLLIPWVTAIFTLYILLFTHAGTYKGVDSRLAEKELPKILKILI